MTTARDIFSPIAPGGAFYTMQLHSLHQQVLAGMEALVALWFDEYTDETDLPPIIDTIDSLLRDVSVGSLSDSELFAKAMASDED